MTAPGSVGAAHRPRLAHLYGLLVLMVGIWALNFIVAKVVVREVPALLAVGLRAALAGVLMLPVYAWWHRGNGGARRSWSWREAPLLLGLGFCGVALNQAFFVLGIARTSVAHAAIMTALAPVMVLLLSAAAGHQRLTGGEILGMAIALGGVTLLELARTAAGTAAPTLAGDLLVFLSSLAFASFAVATRSIARRHDSVTLNTFAYVGGALALLPVTLRLSSGFDFTHVSPLAYAGLLFMALFSSIVAYLIFCYALAHIPAPRVSVFTYLQPLIAMLLAIPLLGERPTSWLAIGAALVLAGVFVTERT